jgi:hypothetical protein
MDTADEAALCDAIQQFLAAFETVFDTDWAYSRQQLGIPTREEDDRARAALLKLFGEAPLSPTATDSTFLHPANPHDLESLNWGNYEHLLKCYARLRSLAPALHEATPLNERS